MKEISADKFIEEIFSEIPEVEVPSDLSFDAAEIMRLAKAQEAQEQQETLQVDLPEGLQSPQDAERLQAGAVRTPSRSRRNYRRFAGLAAAFVLLLAGALYFGQNQENPYLTPGGNFTGDSEEIGDADIPLAIPDLGAAQQKAAEAFEEALEDEDFAALVASLDQGYGYKVLEANDAAEGTEFVVYFYEGEEEARSEYTSEERLKHILWKK